MQCGRQATRRCLRKPRCASAPGRAHGTWATTTPLLDTSPRGRRGLQMVPWWSRRPGAATAAARPHHGSPRRKLRTPLPNTARKRRPACRCPRNRTENTTSTGGPRAGCGLWSRFDHHVTRSPRSGPGAVANTLDMRNAVAPSSLADLGSVQSSQAGVARGEAWPEPGLQRPTTASSGCRCCQCGWAMRNRCCTLPASRYLLATSAPRAHRAHVFVTAAWDGSDPQRCGPDRGDRELLGEPTTSSAQEISLFGAGGFDLYRAGKRERLVPNSRIGSVTVRRSWKRPTRRSALFRHRRIDRTGTIDVGLYLLAEAALHAARRHNRSCLLAFP